MTQLIFQKELIKETTSKVLHERLFMIDASIVKIMKRQRQSTLENLVKEVLDDLKLPL
jgi:cullin-4